MGGSTFRLAKASHQDGRESDEPRPRLSGRHALGQFTTGGATARAGESMLLVFGNHRLDFGKFPNLMTQRLGIAALKSFAATPTFGGHTGHDLLTLLGRNQIAFVFLVAWLAATFAFRLGLVRSRWLIMRVRCRRRHRGVGGRFLARELCLKIRDARDEILK